MSDWNEAIEAAAKVIEVHRGWCNFCRGDAEFCRTFTAKTPSACSVPRLERALKRPEPHVCGMQGYDPMRDAPCPGCEERSHR